MVLVLTRTYFPKGTNGILRYTGTTICATIELPWRDNLSVVSCIPEGEYFIVKRYSKRFSWHLEVVDVTNRSLILFHPANNALKELQGCIAPVLHLKGPGLGLESRKTFTTLRNVVYRQLDAKESVLLLVQS